METYCNQCKKNMSITKFDMKNERDYYTRCKSCRIIHNQKNKESYTSIKKKFSDYDGLTSLGKKKVDCWSAVNDKNPYDVAMGCNKKFWFTCDKCPHEFEKSLDKISGRGGWCPYCSNQKKCNKEDCNYCFEKSVADFDGLTPSGNKIFDRWSDKNPPARDIFKQSNIKLWFDCDKCPHDFESPMCAIYKGHWCPYCCDSVRKLCTTDCDYCFNKSFANFDGLTPSGNKILDRWSDKNIQQPWEISVQCNKKFWFNCDNCPHEFVSSLNKVAGNKPGWCPYCCIPSRKLCKTDCDYCFNKSFANFDGLTPSGNKILDRWSDKNKLKPRDVARRSGIKFWFYCDNCPHEFECSLDSIGSKKSCWCPYCCIPSKQLCKKNCDYCFKKSFANSGLTPSGNKILDCCNDKNKLKPRDVHRGSCQVFHFTCDRCDSDFSKSAYHITQRVWCPHCKNKTELKLHNYLLQHNNIKVVEREYKPKWCSTEYTHLVKNKFNISRYQYRFDFLVTFKNKKQSIIELDGGQHYKAVPSWGTTPLMQQIRDKYKEFKAKEKKIPLIRCIQEDVWMEKNDWQIKLEDKLLLYY